MMLCGRGVGGRVVGRARLILGVALYPWLAGPSPTRATYTPPNPPSRVGARMPRSCHQSWFVLTFHALAMWPTASTQESALRVRGFSIRLNHILLYKGLLEYPLILVSGGGECPANNPPPVPRDDCVYHCIFSLSITSVYFLCPELPGAGSE